MIFMLFIISLNQSRRSNKLQLKVLQRAVSQIIATIVKKVLTKDFYSQ